MYSDPRGGDRDQQRVGASAASAPQGATLVGEDGAPAQPFDLAAAVQHELDAHIGRQRQVLAELGSATDDLIDAVHALTRGGKRLRAAFLYWGYRAAGGAASTAVIRAASAMELFQAAALLHDDVMDNSDIRRGRPTAHRHFADQHDRRQWSGSAQEFGHAAAILAGDLALTWSDEMFAGSGLAPDQAQRGRTVFDRMRTQLMGGQFLDIRESVRSWDDLDYQARIDSCLRVIRYKSAKYSVEQPVLIGASAAGATAHDLEQLSGYGLALGQAFQLRDDVLGVFGDPASTGKPAGDDIREGKRTVIIAEALEAGSSAQTDLIRDSLGVQDLHDDRIAAVREALIHSGALERTEERITADAARARTYLAEASGLRADGRAALDDLIDTATRRQT